MEINYTVTAYETLLGLIEFVESQNTAGAGYRWYKQYEAFIKERFALHTTIPLCKHKTLQRLKLYCLPYKDWTIAFSINENEIVIELLLHKSRIMD